MQQSVPQTQDVLDKTKKWEVIIT